MTDTRVRRQSYTHVVDAIRECGCAAIGETGLTVTEAINLVSEDYMNRSELHRRARAFEHEMAVPDRDMQLRNLVHLERIARQINTPSAINRIGDFVTYDDVRWLVDELRKCYDDGEPTEDMPEADMRGARRGYHART